MVHTRSIFVLPHIYLIWKTSLCMIGLSYAVSWGGSVAVVSPRGYYTLKFDLRVVPVEIYAYTSRLCFSRLRLRLFDFYVDCGPVLEQATHGGASMTKPVDRMHVFHTAFGACFIFVLIAADSG